MSQLRVLRGEAPCTSFVSERQQTERMEPRLHGPLSRRRPGALWRLAPHNTHLHRLPPGGRDPTAGLEHARSVCLASGPGPRTHAGVQRPERGGDQEGAGQKLTAWNRLPQGDSDWRVTDTGGPRWKRPWPPSTLPLLHRVGPGPQNLWASGPKSLWAQKPLGTNKWWDKV